jgi:type I restriction enzyme S subunit
MKCEQKTLAELCTKLTDGTHDSPKLQTSGMPFIKGVHVKQGIIDFENCDYITYEEHEKVIKRSKPEKNDILLANIGINIGELGYVKTDIEFSIKNVALLKVNQDSIDSRYLYYNLKNPSQQERLRNHKGGSAQPFLSLETLRGYKIQFHKLNSTQRKIASILSAYDDLIENNLKRIKLLEEKAFLRYKQIVREERMEEFFIEEVCETLGGGTPATGDRRFWDEGEILWFSPTDLTKHHSIVLLESEKKITELGLQKSSAKLVPPKTILMTSRASIGYFGLINKPATTNQGFINIIPFNENHRAYMLFDLKNRKEEIIGNANGSTFLEISKGKFRQMKIKLPKEEKVLIDFEQEVEVIFNFIENLLKQNTKLREARDILLPKLMNGQIEV